MPGGRARPSWAQYAAQLALVAADRSEDPHVQVGAVAMRADNTVAGIGYNGPPPGVEIDWSDRDLRRPLIVHAEVNALKHTTPADAADGYLVTTHRPCAACMTHIAAYGIRRVLYLTEIEGSVYDSELLDRIALRFGMTVLRIGG